MLVLGDAKVATSEPNTVLGRSTVLLDWGRVLDVLQGDVPPAVLEKAQGVNGWTGRGSLAWVRGHEGPWGWPAGQNPDAGPGGDS